MSESHSGPGSDVFDALTGMFLGEHGSVEGAAARSSSSGAGLRAGSTGASVTLLLPVNLPVLGGPWVEQAAAMLARDGRESVLIRRRSLEICVDRLSQWTDRRVAGSETGGSSIEGVIRMLSGGRPRWIVEIGGPDQVGQWSRTPIERLVVLTGCDEVAVVAAFGRIKELAMRLARTVPIGLVIVGSDGRTARQAATRIVSACAPSIENHVELLGAVHRIVPIDLESMGRYDQAEPSWRVIDLALSGSGREWLEAEHNTGERPGAAVPDEAATEVRLRPALRLTREFEESADDRKSSPQTAPDREERAAPGESAPRRAPEPVVHFDDRAEMDDDDEVEVGSGVAVDLCSFVEGLILLDVQCPRVESAQVGFDQEGGLHVLMRDRGAQSVADLYVAQSWAVENSALIRRVDPWLSRLDSGSPESGSRPVVMHLFTDHPAERRRLADGPIRIHILVDASQGARVGSVYLPL